MTITGKSLAEVANVRFGEMSVIPKTQSSTSITVTTPSHEAGEVDVIMINKNGTSVKAVKPYKFLTKKSRNKAVTRNAPQANRHQFTES